MPLTALIGLVNTLSSISLGAFVLFKNPRGKPHQTYFFFSLSVGLYSIGYFLWGMAPSAEGAMTAFKILTTGIIVVNSFYLEFVFTLLGIRNKRIKAQKNKK